MIVKPLGDRLLVKLVNQENTSKGGIILATATKVEQQVAEIVAIGPEVQCELQIGERVVFGKYVGTEVSIHADKHILIREGDVLAVIE